VVIDVHSIDPTGSCIAHNSLNETKISNTMGAHSRTFPSLSVITFVSPLAHRSFPRHRHPFWLGTALFQVLTASIAISCSPLGGSNIHVRCVRPKMPASKLWVTFINLLCINCRSRFTTFSCARGLPPIHNPHERIRNIGNLFHFQTPCSKKFRDSAH